MAAQPLNDFNPLGDWCAEMLQPLGEVTLVDIVRTHPHLHQQMHQIAHNMHAVVHAAQQHALVTKRNTRIGQHLTCTHRLRRHLVRMVEMGVEPYRMVFLQHCAQFRRNALRTDNRCTAADADNLHMRNRTKPSDYVFQFLVPDHQRVSATEQHIAHALRPFNVFQRLLDAVGGGLAVLLTCKTAAGAVPAVHRAHVGDQEQHTVRIAVGKAGGRRILILVQRVEQVGRGDMGLRHRRYALPPDRIMRVIRIDQAQVIWGDGHAQRLQ